MGHLRYLKASRSGLSASRHVLQQFTPNICLGVRRHRCSSHNSLKSGPIICDERQASPKFGPQAHAKPPILTVSHADVKAMRAQLSHSAAAYSIGDPDLGGEAYHGALCSVQATSRSALTATLPCVLCGP